MFLRQTQCERYAIFCERDSSHYKIPAKAHVSEMKIQRAAYCDWKKMKWTLKWQNNLKPFCDCCTDWQLLYK